MSLSSSSRVLPSVYLLMQTRREDSRWFALTQFQQPSEDAYVYVYVHMYMYVYMYIYIYMYAFTHTYIYTYLYGPHTFIYV